MLPELCPPLVVHAAVLRRLIGRESRDGLHRIGPGRDEKWAVVIRRHSFQRIRSESVMTQQLLGPFDQAGIASAKYVFK